jgi:inner membrane protein
MDNPAIAEARQVKAIADFLYWSRLPFATVERRTDGTYVTIADARYSKGTAAGQFVRKLRLPATPLRIDQSTANCSEIGDPEQC